jgi:membrane protein YdbS with pleckstrin-like domain
MSFSNVQVSLSRLPALDAVTFEPLSARYPRLVLGLALISASWALIVSAVILFVILVPIAGMPAGLAVLTFGFIVALVGFLVWLVHKAARVIGYALRERDVIVRSGVFWRRETVQPINRIQHVEQHQGPLDRRFGLYTLKLFSAGTGHFTFRVPGLDAQSAARIRQFILSAQEAAGEQVNDTPPAHAEGDAEGAADDEARETGGG